MTSCIALLVCFFQIGRQIKIKVWIPDPGPMHKQPGKTDRRTGSPDGVAGWTGSPGGIAERDRPTGIAQPGSPDRDRPTGIAIQDEQALNMQTTIQIDSKHRGINRFVPL
jgi:hypothetical protein